MGWYNIVTNLLFNFIDLPLANFSTAHAGKPARRFPCQTVLLYEEVPKICKRRENHKILTTFYSQPGQRAAKHAPWVKHSTTTRRG